MFGRRVLIVSKDYDSNVWRRVFLGSLGPDLPPDFRLVGDFNFPPWTHCESLHTLLLHEDNLFLMEVPVEVLPNGHVNASRGESLSGVRTKSRNDNGRSLIIKKIVPSQVCQSRTWPRVFYSLDRDGERDGFPFAPCVNPRTSGFPRPLYLRNQYFVTLRSHAKV